jgi:NAD(P)-dependent dehydrogenase (short-subunit alcohol dehydrogenase family)
MNPQETNSGRVALVTGGSKGIGRAIATRLAAEGMVVVVADIDDSGAAETVAAIAAAGGTANARTCDVADTAQCAQLVDAVIAEHARIDVLVNNAARTGDRVSFLDVDRSEWDGVLATNLTATAFLCQASARDMLSRRSGSIVNITSVQRRMPVPTYACYVASKGGIAALTRALAVELSPIGIRVNAIDAGVIATEAFTSSLADAGQLQDGQLPPAPTLLHRSGRPEEIANVVAFLAGEQASFITGAILSADGGRALSRLPDAFEAGFRGYSLPGGS